ncbi:MAG: glycosyltransferase family 4 protein [Anaeromyxobacter sp.]|nr:glycosyltransferase family 4 protein [Anaeromyxobacter sp.]
MTFFHRRGRPGANYSLEFIFDDVRERLAGEVEARVAVAPFISAGILRRALIMLAAAFRQGQVNHVTGDINFAGILLRPSRTIQTIHDCGHLARTTGLRHRLLKLFWVELPVLRCRKVTVVSEATRQELLRHVPWCDPEKVVVIPVAIAAAFGPSPAPFNAARPRVLQVGTAPNKNIARLAAALEGIPCDLEIIGRLQAADEVALRASAIQYRARAGLTPAEVAAAYRRSDLVTLVSTYEGFGMPILEAQAVGRPVLTSTILSMPWVAGGAACLVDPYDVAAIRAGIQRIRSDAGYREGLVRAGHENVRRFDPTVIARQYLALYREVAGAPAARSDRQAAGDLARMRPGEVRAPGPGGGDADVAPDRGRDALADSRKRTDHTP